MKPDLHKTFTIETYNGHKFEVTVNKVYFATRDEIQNYGEPTVRFNIVEVIPLGDLADEIEDAIKEELINERNEEKPF